MVNFLDDPDPIKTMGERKIEADSKVKPWQKTLRSGDCFFYYSLNHNMVIWGEVLPDTDASVPAGYRRCRVYAPNLAGEVGYLHVSVIHRTVSRALFEKAREAGWPHDELSFTGFAEKVTQERTQN